MTSKVRDIAKILGRTETNNTTNIALRLSTENVGLEVYETLADLPTTNLTAGDAAFISPTNRLYVSNGSGWYNVSLINAAPYWDSAPSDQYTIVDSATPLIITAKALDSDNPDTILSNLSGSA